MVAFQPRYGSLVELFQSSVRQYADRPLFGTKQRGAWSFMTYAQFERAVDSMRTALADLGIAAGDRVAIIASDRPEWAIAAYATYGLGGVFVAMYESQTEGDWAHILADCGAKVLFVPGQVIARRVRDMLPRLPALRTLVVLEGPTEMDMRSYGTLLAEGQKRATPSITPRGEDVAAILYTSGTTGTPRGVELTHANLASNVSALRDIFPVDSTDRSVAFLPWAHAFGQTAELHAILSLGASMGIATHPDHPMEEIAELEPTILLAVPRFFNRIYDELHEGPADGSALERRVFEEAFANAKKRRELAAQRRTSGVADLKHLIFDHLVFSKLRARLGGRLKFAFCGAAALSREVAEFVDDIGITVFEGYGLTETSPIVAANHPGARKIGSVGRPVPGVRVEIDTSATGDPKNGEVVVFGHAVMKGYHGLPEDDAKVFVVRDGERGVRTGDMGYLDGEGYLHITGRIKEQYKLANGKYVVPTPLEEELRLSPYVHDAMIFGENEESNSAIIVPDFDVLTEWARSNGITGDPPSLVANERVRALLETEIARCSASFRPYERIRYFVLGTVAFTPDNGMLTPTMKVRRQRVLEVYAREIAASRAHRPL